MSCALMIEFNVFLLFYFISAFKLIIPQIAKVLIPWYVGSYTIMFCVIAFTIICLRTQQFRLIIAKMFFNLNLIMSSIVKFNILIRYFEVQIISL